MQGEPYTPYNATKVHRAVADPLEASQHDDADETSLSRNQIHTRTGHD